MSAPTIGELFAGYGGLGLALEDVLGAQVKWVSEFEAAPSRILAHRFPDAPNLGDITKIDWSQVEPVDIITGGSPCQDLSHAGKRAGMRAGTRSGLWASMCDAIDIIRPSLVVWENVRGAYSACASSDSDGVLGHCPRCVDPAGRRKHDPNLRALGRVLGDLAELGYDAAWVGLRAADVGAPHGRYRVFVLAWPTADTDGLGLEWSGSARVGRTGPAHGDQPSLSLLPTPVVNDMGAGKTVGAWDAWTERLKSSHGNGNGHGPTSMDSHASGGGYNGQTNVTLTDATVRKPAEFGQYAPAINRWESILRPAPSPTEPTGKGGAHRLSPRFVEWMMGLPDGWVTDTDTTRNEQLKALGNGVVPQQAAAAIRHLLAVRASVVTERAA